MEQRLPSSQGIVIPFPSRVDAPPTRDNAEAVIGSYKELRDLRKRIDVELAWCSEFLKAACTAHGGPIKCDAGTARITVRRIRKFDVQAVYKTAGIKVFLTLISVVAASIDAAIKLGLLSQEQADSCCSIEEQESIDVR